MGFNSGLKGLISLGLLDYRPQIIYIPVFLVLLFCVYFVVTRTGLLVVV